MDSYEKVDYLRSRADISDDTAYEILEGTNWNVSLAEEALKKEGLYREETTTMDTKDYTKREDKSVDIRTGLKEAGKWLWNLICKGMENDFCVYTKKGRCMALPLTVLAILALAALPFVMVCLIILFFSGCRFGLRGPETDYSKANDILSKVRFECR